MSDVNKKWPIEMPADADASLRAIEFDGRARSALTTLAATEDPAAIWRVVSELSSALADLLADEAAKASTVYVDGKFAQVMTRDVVERYEGLARAVKKSTLSFLAKKRRTYLELRIMRAAERSTKSMEAAAQLVVSRTHDQDPKLSAELVEHESELVACLRAAVARRPKNYRWAPPGKAHEPHKRKYEETFAALCRALGLPLSDERTRGPARSRVRRQRPLRA
jgi:hypothetical protein